MSAFMTMTIVKDSIKSYYLLKEFRETQELLKNLKTSEIEKKDKENNKELQ
jgi:hypothetical protein